MAIHNDMIMLLTWTLIHLDKDNKAIAAWGNKTDLFCPLSYDPTQIQETLVSLTLKGSANLFKLPISTDNPIPWTPARAMTNQAQINYFSAP